MNTELQRLEIKVENNGATLQGRLSATEWNIVVAALKSLDASGGNLDPAAILKIVHEAGYVTREDIADIALQTIVTTTTEQKILAVKDFDKGFKIGGLPIYKSQDDTIYIDANLVVRGGITARGTNETITPSIFEALPIDGDTIKRTADGRLYVDADALNISGGGGVADSVSWENVTGKPLWIGSTKPTYTPQEIGALPIAGGAVNGQVRITSLDTTPLIINSTSVNAGTYLRLDYQNSKVAEFGHGWGLGTYMTTNNHILRLTDTGDGMVDSNIILHSGNYSNYTLPTSGGTVNGKVCASDVTTTTNWINDTGQVRAACSGTSYKIGIGATSGGYAIVQGGQSGVGAIPLLLNPSGGNVSVGGVTADDKLHVHGNILAAGGITARYTSDERLKKNLRPINAGKMILSLGRVREFEYIDSEVEKNNLYKGSHIGLIYQDVKGSALSNMCFEREDGYGSLNYLEPSLISLLAGVGQEHEVRIQQLERENKALKKKVEQLEKRVV